MLLPTNADREGSFQADICFMPEDQVFNGYQCIVCLISTTRKIAWCVPYKAPRNAEGKGRQRQIPTSAMCHFAQCTNEIERQFHLQVKQIEIDDESMFKGDC